MTRATGATVIRALGWDHPRCSQPMLATAAQWNATHPSTPVEWTFRSLADFESQPLSETVLHFDVITLDHPLVPGAVAEGLVLPFESLVPSSLLETIARRSIGATATSYQHRGRTWALPVDAASHVSAWGSTVDDRPTDPTWDDVLLYARTTPRPTAIPLNPTHALCAVFTVMASAGAPFVLGEVASDALESAIERLAELLPHLHPSSLVWSPIDVLENIRLGAVDYSPLTFGYVSYGDAHFGRPVRFGPVPRCDDHRRSATLGGAGVAISAATAVPSPAAAFCVWLMEESTQRDIQAHGGQPSNALAWQIDEPRFSRDTAEALIRPFVRPQLVRWREFESRASDAVHSCLSGDTTSGAAAASVRSAFDEARRIGPHQAPEQARGI